MTFCTGLQENYVYFSVWQAALDIREYVVAKTNSDRGTWEGPTIARAQQTGEQTLISDFADKCRLGPADRYQASFCHLTCVITGVESGVYYRGKRRHDYRRGRDVDDGVDAGMRLFSGAIRLRQFAQRNKFEHGRMSFLRMRWLSVSLAGALTCFAVPNTAFASQHEDGQETISYGEPHQREAANYEGVWKGEMVCDSAFTLVRDVGFVISDGVVTSSSGLGDDMQGKDTDGELVMRRGVVVFTGSYRDFGQRVRHFELEGSFTSKRLDQIELKGHRADIDCTVKVARGISLNTPKSASGALVPNSGNNLWIGHLFCGDGIIGKLELEEKNGDIVEYRAHNADANGVEKRVEADLWGSLSGSDGLQLDGRIMGERIFLRGTALAVNENYIGARGQWENHGCSISLNLEDTTTAIAAAQNDETPHDQPAIVKDAIVEGRAIEHLLGAEGKSMVQIGLTMKGLFSGEINGKFETATRDALKVYQRDNGYTVTGYLSVDGAVELMELGVKSKLLVAAEAERIKADAARKAEEARVAAEAAEKERLEAAQLAAEATRKRKAEEARVAAARQKQLVADRKAAEAERDRKIEEARVAAAAAEKERLEAVRVAAEATRKRKAEEARVAAAAEKERLEAARLAAEEERKRKVEEARVAAAAAEKEQQETARLAAEAERKRKAEEARVAAAAAEKERLEAARLAAEAERKRKAEEARVAAAAAEKEQQETARLAAEAERKRKAEEVRVAAAAAEKEQLEAASVAAEAERKRKAEEVRVAAAAAEKKRLEAARVAAEAERKRKAEEARVAAARQKQLEAEQQAAEAERNRKTEEARVAAAAEEKKRLEAARMAAEAERKRKAEEARVAAAAEEKKRLKAARVAAEATRKREAEEARVATAAEATRKRIAEEARVAAAAATKKRDAEAARVVKEQKARLAEETRVNVARISEIISRKISVINYENDTADLGEELEILLLFKDIAIDQKTARISHRCSSITALLVENYARNFSEKNVRGMQSMMQMDAVHSAALSVSEKQGNYSLKLKGEIQKLIDPMTRTMVEDPAFARSSTFQKIWSECQSTKNDLRDKLFE